MRVAMSGFSPFGVPPYPAGDAGGGENVLREEEGGAGGGMVRPDELDVT
jgi:hypothetical protein